MTYSYPIYFPYLGKYLSLTGVRINPVMIRLFGMPIYWYGVILTMGMFLGLVMARWIAKKEQMNPELIIDFLLYDIIFAVAGARAYYVFFEWDYYKKHVNEIFNLRQGGIAIYGAILASVLVAVIYTKMKKINFWKFADVTSYGLLVGQAIGRYGNFVNREAFGDYTDHLFAMQIAKSEAATALTPNILNHVIIKQGIEYIQVHPTFLYESCWNIALVILLLFYRKRKRQSGEIFFLYVMGYGLGRLWIEALRTDQLLVPGIHIAASQIVAVLSVLIGAGGYLWCRIQYYKFVKFKKM